MNNILLLIGAYLSFHIISSLACFMYGFIFRDKRGLYLGFLLLTVSIIGGTMFFLSGGGGI